MHSSDLINDSGSKTDDPVIDAKTFWRALGERAMGVTVVTGQDGEGPAGMLALSVAHVTANPPTMLVSVDHRTSARATLIAARHFAVNVLPREAADVADSFGGKDSRKGAERFEPHRWTRLRTGAPIFVGALAALDCVVEDVVERNDVSVFFGRVVACATRGDGDPLIYFRGRYLG